MPKLPTSQPQSEVADWDNFITEANWTRTKNGNLRREFAGHSVVIFTKDAGDTYGWVIKPVNCDGDETKFSNRRFDELEAVLESAYLAIEEFNEL